MNKELYTHFIYLSNFYKTTELKISSSDKLEINEVSAFGSSHKKIDLCGTILKTKNDKLHKKHNFSMVFILLSAIGLLSSTQFLTNYKPELLLALIGFASVLLSIVFISVTFHSKKFYTLNKLSTNEVIYKFKLDQDSSPNNEEISDFIQALKERISSKDTLDNYVDIATNFRSAEEQYNDLIYHLECLYNSGVIDDTTFDRIDSNISDKIYPNIHPAPKPLADVIYLNKKTAHIT